MNDVLKSLALATSRTLGRGDNSLEKNPRNTYITNQFEGKSVNMQSIVLINKISESLIHFLSKNVRRCVDVLVRIANAYNKD